MGTGMLDGFNANRGSWPAMSLLQVIPLVGSLAASPLQISLIGCPGVSELAAARPCRRR
jgi:hypothetical protein